MRRHGIAEHDDELAAHPELGLASGDLCATSDVDILAGDTGHQTNS